MKYVCKFFDNLFELIRVFLCYVFYSNLSKLFGFWCNGLLNKNGEFRFFGMEVYGIDVMSSSVVIFVISIILFVVVFYLLYCKVLYWYVL